MVWKECAIVDDNKFDRLICRKIINKINEGIELKEFQTGKEILDFLHESDALNDQTLILLDLNMPEMNGYEFLEALDRDTQLNGKRDRIGIVIITSSTRNEDKDRAMGFKKVIGFLQKPILKQHLESLFEQMS